jgi:hypothetical protein
MQNATKYYLVRIVHLQAYALVYREHRHEKEEV